MCRKLAKAYGLRTLDEPEPSEVSTNKKKTPFFNIFIMSLKNFRLKRNSDSDQETMGVGTTERVAQRHTWVGKREEKQPVSTVPVYTDWKNSP